MRNRTLLLVCSIVGLLVGLAQADAPSTLSWTDTTRDVYIDGELDRSAQVMRCSTPPCVALISSRLDQAMILSLPDRSVSTLPAEAFHFASNRVSATSEANTVRQPAGTFTQVDSSTFLLGRGGKSILIGPHQGAVGELSEEKLWETVPVWRSLMESYEPQPQAVAALKAYGKRTTVTLVFGTWCGDSKNYVPRLLKALRAAANAEIQVKLVAIDGQFSEPVSLIAPRRIINVPTILVERDGIEIGRIVETPAAQTMEEDLVAILSGRPNVHLGRYERGPAIASGEYLYRDQRGKESGRERWTLHRTPDGGKLVHSLITSGALTTEVFSRTDAEGRPMMAEITKQQGEGLTRQRVFLDGRTLTARLRGNVSGIISQTLDVPEAWTLASPAIAADGWSWSPSGASPGSQPMMSYVVSRELGGAMGSMIPVTYEARGEETLRVPAGQFRTRALSRKRGEEISDWWLHPALGIPVRGRLAGGRQFVLSSLTIEEAASGRPADSTHQDQMR